MPPVVDKTWRFLGSYGLAAVTLVLLAVLTFFGTWEQGRSTLYDVQTRYFESLGVVHWIGGKYPLPLPGGYLLMGILFVNLVVGGLIRVRKDAARVGVFVIHIGMALLLFGAFLEDMMSVHGMLSISEPGYTASPNEPSPPNRSREFVSSREWEVVIRRPNRDGSKSEFVIPQEKFEGLSGDDTLRVSYPDLPFDLVLSDYMRNSRLQRVPPDQAGEGVNGLKLTELEPVGAKARLINGPGLHGRVVSKDTSQTLEGLLHGGASNTLRFTLTDQTWNVELQKRTWLLPFDVELTKFVHEIHPGTGMARRFSSYVNVVEPGAEGPDGRNVRNVHITMNEPLRYGVYTLYQTNWGPQQVRGPSHYYSVLEVVKAPSEDWSLWPILSCAVIFLGLLIHFVMKLVKHLKNEARKRNLAMESV